MKLRPISTVKQAPRILYRLLAARPVKVNISHKKMPTFAEHLAFIRRKPYKAWYLIEGPSLGYLGSIYISKNDEIGLFLFKEFQHKGYARRALMLLMKRHKGIRRFLANVNPKNTASINFFKKMNFSHVQNTYEFRR